MFQAPSLNFLLILPWLIIVGTGIIAMLLDLIVRRTNKTWIAWLSLAGITLALIQTVGLWGVDSGTFTPEGGTPMVVVDNYSLFINAIILMTAFMTVLISLDYLRKVDLEKGEYYYLMLFSRSTLRR